MKIYYAHCVQLYGSQQELRDIDLLKSLGFEVVNPNLPKHQSGYNKKGMDYFIEDILPYCDGCAFRALPDGSIPAGVGKEVKEMIRAAKPVIELPNFALRNWMDVADTRMYLHECGER